MLYLLLGSLSGTSPGLPLGANVLPLNLDAYFNLTLNNPNAAPLSQSLSLLDGAGEGQAAFGLPPASSPALAGLTAHHAYLVIDTFSAGSPTIAFTSNAQPVNFE